MREDACTAEVTANDANTIASVAADIKDLNFINGARLEFIWLPVWVYLINNYL